MTEMGDKGKPAPLADGSVGSTPDRASANSFRSSGASSGLSAVLSAALPGLSLDGATEQLHQAIRAADPLDGPATQWTEVLAQIVGQLGIGVTPVSRSSRDAVRTADPQAPLITCSTTDAGTRQWVLLTHRRRRRARAWVGTQSQVQREWVGGAALEHAMGRFDPSVARR